MIKYLIFLIPIILATDDVTQRELKAIKGVPVSRYSLYQPSLDGKNFKCLDGSRVILYSQLNDNYCDCTDGSDEPGTSACQNGQFYCSNVGHKGNFIPTTRVNDKLCDCCDGSDEYDSGITCPNICDELGRAARVEKERVASIARKGYAKRNELAKEGQAMKDERLKDLGPLTEQKNEIEPKMKTLEDAKRSAEDLERKLQDEHRNKWNAANEEKKLAKSVVYFDELDVNQDGKLTIDELTGLKYLDEDRNGETSVEEAKVYLGSVEEADKEHFHKSMYDRMTNQKKHFEEETRLADEMEAEKMKAMEHAGDEPDDDELLAEEDRESHDNAPNESDDKMPPYPEEVNAASEAAREARRQYDEVHEKFQDIEAKIREAQEFSNADYGEDLAWAALKGKCFERNVQQYTYEFCPFGQNTQKDTGAYSGTSLGSFKNWSGKGHSKYAEQHYGDGQQCWNGPKRSTDVAIECGEESELVEVTEPAKCEYRFVFRTPLACGDPDNEQYHEEL